MTSRLDSDLLRTFVAIADTGSFTRAADMVRRTQSAVSMQVKRLEETVGQSLFDRNTRGVALTPSGERLLTNARRVVKLLDDTVSSLQGQELEGAVCVGVPEEYGTTLLPDILARFSETHSHVQVTVRCEASEGFAEALKSGEIDLAVIVADPGDEQGEILFHDPLVWVSSERYLVHEEDPVPVAVFERGCWWRGSALKSLSRQGRRYHVAYSSASAAGIQAAVSSGLAVAVLGQSTIPTGVRLLTIDDGYPRLPGSSVVLRTRTGMVPEAVEAMVTAIKDAFRRPLTSQ